MQSGMALRRWRRAAVAAFAVALGIAFMHGPGARADSSSGPYIAGPPWSVVGTGDFNGDGLADIVWYNSSTGETQIWFMDGKDIEAKAPVEYQGSPAYVGPPWSIAGVGDMNHDGIADILWYNSSTGQMQIWYLSPGFHIDHIYWVEKSSGAVAAIGPPFSIVGAGTSEIFWHNSAANETQIWFLNDANGHIIDKEDVVNEPPPPPPPAPPTPPTPPKVKSIELHNCYGSVGLTGDTSVNVMVWIRDVTLNHAWGADGHFLLASDWFPGGDGVPATFSKISAESLTLTTHSASRRRPCSLSPSLAPDPET